MGNVCVVCRGVFRTPELPKITVSWDGITPLDGPCCPNCARLIRDAVTRATFIARAK